MKILYLVDPQQDYLTSMIFDGLCSLIKEENVYVYPMLKRWKYGTTDDWYILPDGKKGWTGKSDYEPIRANLPELTLDEICAHIEEFDYIILCSPREYVIKSFRYIRDKLGILTNKVAFLDGEDGNNIHTELIDIFQPNYLFKREIFYDAQYKNKKIYPLPFSSFALNLYINSDSIKTLNVFGVFGNTNYLRVRLVEEFHRLNIDKSIVDIDSGATIDSDKARYGKMSYNDYMQKIASSKIGLSCIGHGKDCVRYWEIPSYRTMMMCVNPKIVIPFPFKDRETAVFIKEDLSNLRELLEYYLSHDDERKAIAQAGHEHLMKYHTNKKRVQYMLDIMEANA
jgi:hypothetical protein